MKNIYDLIDDVNEKIRDMILDMEYVKADKLGLDNRCGRLYVNEDCIITEKHNDRLLQYYGGFEYVDKDYRNEIGDFVIYLRDEERVLNHIDRYYEQAEAEA